MLQIFRRKEIKKTRTYSFEEISSTKKECMELLDGRVETTHSNLNSNSNQMRYGLELQDKGTASLKQTSRIIEDAKQIGIDINQKLEKQNDQIVNIHDDLESVESTLERSKKIIIQMARRIATDKVLKCLTFLLFVSIIVVLLLSFVIPRRKN